MARETRSANVVTEPRRPRPAECFPPGEYLRDELEARGWTVDDLLRRARGYATTTWVSAADVQGVLDGGLVGPRMAFTLRRAFGTSAQYWLNLSNAYEEWHARQAARQQTGSSRKGGEGDAGE